MYAFCEDTRDLRTFRDFVCPTTGKHCSKFAVNCRPPLNCRNRGIHCKFTAVSVKGVAVDSLQLLQIHGNLSRDGTTVYCNSLQLTAKCDECIYRIERVVYIDTLYQQLSYCLDAIYVCVLLLFSAFTRKIYDKIYFLVLMFLTALTWSEHSNVDMKYGGVHLFFLSDSSCSGKYAEHF